MEKVAPAFSRFHPSAFPGYRLRLAGCLLAASVAVSIAADVDWLPPLAAGCLQLAAAILLWPEVTPAVRRQSVILTAIGVGCFVLVPGGSFVASLSKNQAMIAMLASVGILRLIPVVAGRELPVGRKALWRTVFGVHWLGAVINISALVIFCDRLTLETRSLTRFQGLAVTRGFSLAAIWSPFFVAMGVALTHAPGTDFSLLVLAGLPLSQLLLLSFVWRAGRHRREEVAAFSGYPFRPETLLAPMVLTAAVIGGHFAFPAVTIITLITFLAPAYAFLMNARRHPVRVATGYVARDLPRMGPEVLLFVGAGILGAGLMHLTTSLDLRLPPGAPDSVAAFAALAFILAMAGIGIHPVVSISVIGGVLAPSGIRPELLAMSFLMGWALGVLINPISGVHLLMAGRYRFDTREVRRQNGRFVAVALLLCGLWMYAFDFLLQSLR